MKHVELSSVTKCLVEGRAKIEAGWTKHVFQDGDKVCAFEAISYSAAASDACGQLQAALPHGISSIVAYNDCVATTKADILALYDRAILASLNDG